MVRDASLLMVAASSILSILGIKIPVIAREANPISYNLSGVSFRKKLLLIPGLHIAYRLCNSIIANSPFTSEETVRVFCLPPQRICVIPNPVEINFTHDDLSLDFLDQKTRSYKSSGKYLMLSVGRLHHQKNHLMLLRAFKLSYKHNNSLRLTILGSGPLYSVLRQYVDSNGLSDVVSIAPFTSHIAAYYAASNLFLCTLPILRVLGMCL